MKLQLSKFFIPMAIAIVFITSLASLAKQPQILDPIIKTQSGSIKGIANESGSVMMFKGIPYAAPPVGNLRWREPQPPKSWKGVRDASKFGASAIQNRAFSRNPWTKEFMVQDSVSEDCLFLNIWTPAKTANDKLPILFYIHGGGLSEGSGSVGVYDGEEMARKGIIFITVNYRLGFLGFFAHPELTAESPHHASGNYGFQDQVAALKWVKNNISAFGGDPSRVTIAGQSAGAASVRELIISPLAAGLFCGAITQSGSSFASGPMGGIPLSEGEKQGVEFAKSKGASSLAELRKLSAMDIIAVDNSKPTVRPSVVIDGYFQTDDMMKIFAEKKQNDTPFMSGGNADETRYAGEKGNDFISLYPSGSKEEATAAEKVAGQEQSRLNTYLWMEYRAKTSKTKSYQYFFDRAIPWPEHPEFGAFHTGEVPYVFNNMKQMVSHTMEKTDAVVAENLSNYWVNFVKTGNPNGAGLPVWESYSKEKHEVMRLGAKLGMIPIAASEKKFEFLKMQLLGSKK